MSQPQEAPFSHNYHKFYLELSDLLSRLEGAESAAQSDKLDTILVELVRIATKLGMTSVVSSAAPPVVGDKVPRVTSTQVRIFLTACFAEINKLAGSSRGRVAEGSREDGFDYVGSVPDGVVLRFPNSVSPASTLSIGQKRGGDAVPRSAQNSRAAFEAATREIGPDVTRADAHAFGLAHPKRFGHLPRQLRDFERHLRKYRGQ